MIGKLISHYRIIEKLGEGGMGVVYKAEDTRLKRTVALKFLPPELIRDPEAKARFIREAQAASSLDHPNICTIYEINETEDGRLFIAMAGYEGETLKNRIKSGESHVGAIPRIALKIDECINIAIQIAEGLGKAHEKGIVHRDIKPANIFITNDGLVKILDFGLAKLAGQAQVTKDSSTLGTVAYMSPEQLSGNEVDQRTDIWSLGVVLYEMLTGELPFPGDYEQAIIYAILNEEPQRPSSLRKGISTRLEEILIRAIEKDPADRYQTIKDILSDFEFEASRTKSVSVKTQKYQGRIWGIRKPVFYSVLAALVAAVVLVVRFILTSEPAAPGVERSIIVLPFQNISPDSEQDYFCDGMTEELITTLSRLGDLLVISRSSAMTFRNTEKTIPEIARMVNVRYVLEGSVRKVGNDLRITAKLIDSKKDAHLWADNYTGSLDDIFDIQENVSRSIANSLKIQLGSAGNSILSERSISEVQAYEFYLKARQEIYRFSEESLDRAVHYLEKGLEISGENPLLLSCMGNAYYQYWNMGIRKDEVYMAKARECADRIFKTEPDSPHGRMILGLLETFINPPQAVRQFKTVLTDNPYDNEALLWLCISYIHLGKDEEVGPFLERLVKTDPLHPIVKILPGLQFYYRGEWGRALEVLENTYRSGDEDLLALWHIGRVLASCDRNEDALSAFETVARKGRSGFAKFSRLFELALRGEEQDILLAATAELDQWAQKDYMASFWLAECLALVGEHEKAMDWLENAVNCGLINYPLLNEVDPFLVNIRTETRFKKLMERVKHQWENFKI